MRLDKIIIDEPHKDLTLTVSVEVEFSRKYKLRLFVGKALIRLAVWIMGVGLNYEEVEEVNGE